MTDHLLSERTFQSIRLNNIFVQNY